MLNVALLILLLTVSWGFAIAGHKDSFLAHKQNLVNAQKFLLFALPPLIIGIYFVAFKPFSAGGDTYSYLMSFSKLDSPLTATNDANYGPEPLFWPIQAIIKFFVNERGWYIVNFAITSTLYYIAYKKLTKGTKITPLLFALVFLTYYVIYGGNAMRQAYSIPLGVIAFHYAYNKNHIKYLAYSLLAVSFHWSGFVVFLFPFILKIPNRRFYYIAAPISALLTSMLMLPIAQKLIPYIQFDWLLIKIHAYVFGLRESHITAIWHTLNFWLCVATYILLIVLNTSQNQANEKILKYIMLFFCLMLFSVNNTDISDRYMVHFLFVSPLAFVLIVDSLRIPTALKNITLMLIFTTMSFMVYTRESAVQALGIGN